MRSINILAFYATLAASYQPLSAHTIVTPVGFTRLRLFPKFSIRKSLNSIEILTDSEFRQLVKRKWLTAILTLANVVPLPQLVLLHKKPQLKKLWKSNGTIIRAQGRLTLTSSLFFRCENMAHLAFLAVESQPELRRKFFKTSDPNDIKNLQLIYANIERECKKNSHEIEFFCQHDKSLCVNRTVYTFENDHRLYICPRLLANWQPPDIACSFILGLSFIDSSK